MTSTQKWMSGYFTYLVVGGALGLVSWAIQLGLKLVMGGLGLPQEVLEAVTVILAFAVMGLIGFLTHRTIVFRAKGNLLKFYVVGACIILSVALLTALLTTILSQFDARSLSIFAYPTAAILMSPASYVFKKYWVYERKNVTAEHH